MKVSFFVNLQQNFDVLWCRGSVQNKIFTPWLESMKIYGCKFHGNSKVTDFILDGNNGTIAEVVCGQEAFQADAVILAEGVSAIQSTVSIRYPKYINFLGNTNYPSWFLFPIKEQ